MQALQALLLQHQDLNFKHEHMFTDLDDLVTPLTAAAHLGRYEIVGALLETRAIDVNLATEASGERQHYAHTNSDSFHPVNCGVYSREL